VTSEALAAAGGWGGAGWGGAGWAGLGRGLATSRWGSEDGWVRAGQAGAEPAAGGCAKADAELAPDDWVKADGGRTSSRTGAADHIDGAMASRSDGSRSMPGAPAGPVPAGRPSREAACAPRAGSGSAPPKPGGPSKPGGLS